MTEEFQPFDNQEEDAFNYEVKEFRKSPKSVFFVNMESVYSDSYPAKFNAELVRLLISLYSNKKDIVFDPMCGSGTVPLIAGMLGRYGIGLDVNPKAITVCKDKLEDAKMNCKIEPQIQVEFGEHDSHNPFPIGKAKAGLIVTSPPFGVKAIVGTKKQYSNESADITNAASYDDWRKGLKAILKNCFDVLMPGRLMIVEIRPRSVEGHDQPMDLWIQNDAIELGFVRWSRIIEVTDPWRMYTVKDKENEFAKPYPGHSDLLLFKKPLNSRLT